MSLLNHLNYHFQSQCLGRPALAIQKQKTLAHIRKRHANPNPHLNPV